MNLAKDQMLQFYCRADYIGLLNANTLSLDGIASLNSALRELVYTDNWNKHQHVQWLITTIHEILKSLIEAFKPKSG